MALTNLKTVKMTATVAGVMPTIPADRIGLGFGAARDYPADTLSLGQFPTPHNPEPEQLRSRQEWSATQMRKQTRTDTPPAVPPASSAGCVPGLTAARVWWSLTTDTGRSLTPVGVVRNRFGSDCQSPDRADDKAALLRETAPATAAGK